MMNLDTINEVWNEFSNLKNTELIRKERKHGDTVQSHYLINYTDEIATFSFIGMLWTSSDKKSTDKTSIIIEFDDRLTQNNFELKITNENNISSDDKTTDFEKSILESLKKINGNSFTLRDTFIRIDTNHIFSNIDEFKDVIDLIVNIKNKA